MDRSTAGQCPEGVEADIRTPDIRHFCRECVVAVVSINIGTAGWSIPRQISRHFPAQGSALHRYAARFPVVEINSSFHRPHRLATWERWRDSVPDAFRFSVKLPKQITHELKLIDCSEALQRFLEQAAVLDQKLAVLLVQLPPKQTFDESVALKFFQELATRIVRPIGM